MPVPVALFVALALGIALGLRRAGALGAGGVEAANRAVALFAALALFPSLAFAALYKPAWAWLHIADADRLPSAANLLVCAGVAALAVAGHRLGQLLGRLQGRAGLVAAAIPAAFAVLLSLGLHRRIEVLDDARRSADATPLLGSRFAAGLVVLDILLAVAVWLTVRAIDAAEAAPNEGSTVLHARFRAKRTDHG